MLKKCVILKKHYDNHKLLKDYYIAKETNFTKRTYVKGASVSLYRDTIGWHSIPLHSINGLEGNEGNILRNIDSVKFEPTPTLLKCNYFQKILNDLNTDIYLVRLMKLDGNGYIAPHSDAPQFKNMLEIIRCCIPIVTNEQVDFSIDNEQFNLTPNILWYTDVTKEHWVKNNSSVDRIHLVIDIKPTPEMMYLIGLTQLNFFKKFYFKNNILENKSIRFEMYNQIEFKRAPYCLIMCQWKRFHTLNLILDSIESQNTKVDVYLWNNNYEDKHRIINILKSRKNLRLNIYLYNSEYNIKCIGRLLTAYLIKYLYKKIIFFDDDEVMLSNDVVETFINESNTYPNTIISWWAHNIKSFHQFYDRVNMQYTNNVVNYAGGGGCLIPPELFSPHFMNWLPSQFFNVEDFLCNVYMIYYMEGANRASKANINFIDNESVSQDSLSFGKKHCDRTGIEIHQLKDLCLQWSIKNYNYPIYSLSKNNEKRISDIKITDKKISDKKISDKPKNSSRNNLNYKSFNDNIFYIRNKTNIQHTKHNVTATNVNYNL